MAHRIDAGGMLREIAPANGTDFSLEELQTIVGGYIEAFYLRNGTIMMLNENGKSLALPVNLIATQIAHAHGLPGNDCIVGNVVIGTWREMGGPADGDEES